MKQVPIEGAIAGASHDGCMLSFISVHRPNVSPVSEVSHLPVPQSASVQQNFVHLFASAQVEPAWQNGPLAGSHAPQRATSFGAG